MDLLNNFINNVIILDDQESEIQQLKIYLESQDIKVDYYSDPEDLLSKKQIHSKDLLILDFRLLADESNIATIMSKIIRPILEKHFNKNHPYGIIIWSKHDEEYMSKFYDVLKKDTIQTHKYDTPIFIINLDKNLYLSKQKQYRTILKNINQELNNSITASFFINWNENVKLGVYKSIKDIYSLSEDYSLYNKRIQTILHRLALNYTGCLDGKLKRNYNLTVDAYKSLTSLLHSDVMTMQACSSVKNIFTNYQPMQLTDDEKLRTNALLNSKLFLDDSNLTKKLILPGNIYSIKKKNDYTITKEQRKDMLDNMWKKVKKEGLDKKSIKITDIAIVLTPPCDFSNKKILSRFVFGIKIDIKSDYYNSIYQQIKLKAGYLYPLYPLAIIDNYYSIFLFDFRNLTSLSKKEINEQCLILIKARENLFADILQKFSSHASRLGISMFE